MRLDLFFQTHIETSRVYFKNIFYEVKREIDPFFALARQFSGAQPRPAASYQPFARGGLFNFELR